MILKALTDYYETLLSRGEISRPGWGEAKVGYGLELAENGEISNVLPLMDTSGKKPVPRIMTVPMPVKRTVGIESNFLCDNSSYILGADEKGKPKRTADCFDACKILHHAILDGLDHPAARAILNFFDTWIPGTEHPLLNEAWKDLMAGRNLVFWYEGTPIHDIPEIRQRWQKHYDDSSENANIRCLVTGEKAALEPNHPVIKGVPGAQSSGATLVSFNAPSFWSYGSEFGKNAPVGKYAAFAYTTALNHLLSDRDHVQRFGEAMTVVCWAFSGESAYQDVCMGMMDPTDGTYTEQDLLTMLSKLSKGEKAEWDETLLDPEMQFYILGLSPNAARISVRFFWQNSFGDFAKNVLAHSQRIEITKPTVDHRPALTPWWLAQETVNANARKSDPQPQLAGALLLSILQNTPYPETLHSGVVLRIRAEQKITWGRAAILKAQLLKNHRQSPNYDQLLEVAQVELNEKCEYLPYVLGRLFRLMEYTQQASTDWTLNRTIKDSYFNSAAATPRGIFARLFPLHETHMKKLRRDKPGLAKKLEADKQELLGMIRENLPARFTPEETDCFYIGYYHEANQKKEEK